jgi:biopolymer transport protein ExbD
VEEKNFDYINVIPLVDIMLVLLTIVLTTSSFIATGMIPVELPKAAKSREEALRTQTIEIDPQGKLYWNARPLGLPGLRDTLRTMDKKIPIVIKADRNITLQAFVDVLDLVKTSGFTRVSLQTEKTS